ncbi:hypothetical protein RR42_m1468 [Cupriavidus basilensis]|uniref:Uncharacterized protein n=1 Tax=Cupriavidus basilensis TaxID=68895 RepID=A0A0C4Y9E3_9BURK|nr:hypothetical protein RR42_m1468 [Cupriavidus basilensis]
MEGAGKTTLLHFHVHMPRRVRPMRMRSPLSLVAEAATVFGAR